jgi:hypothetical protein
MARLHFVSITLALERENSMELIHVNYPEHKKSQ